MGFFDTLIEGIGAVVDTVVSVFESLVGAITGQPPAPSQGGGGAPSSGQTPQQPPFSRTQPAGGAVQPCPVSAAAAACPGVLSSAAEKRAGAKYATLSATDKKVLDDALANAKSDCERAYILKAFAACHTAQECSDFGQKIAGKSDTWMKDNLSLTGDSNGKGVQQQWSHSCNATTAQAVRGQMDPIYALGVHEANPNMGKVDNLNATKENPNLAEEQRQMLTSTYKGAAAGDHAGTAVARNAGGGSGRWADDLFNKSSEATGVTYATQKNPADPIPLIDNGLATGAPVPIVIGNGPGQYTHYVLVTAVNPGPPKTYTIHDPWDGITVTRTEQEIKDGKINLANSNKITAVEVPTPVAKAANKPPC